MKAGLYIRVSTEEQAIKGYSVPEQIDACIKKALDLGATDYIIFCEEGGESGAFIDRPELERLFTAVRSGEIQLVIALDTDRLARDLGTQIAIANEIEKYARLDFVFYSRGNPDNPEDNLFFHIKGAFAQYERAKIRQRTSYGRKRKALMGKIVIPGGWKSHPGAYGYRYIKDDPRFEVEEKEADVVRYIFDLAYSEQYGIMRIVEHLNNKGIPSPKGSIWHSSTVGRILKSELYAGVFYNFKFRSYMTNKRTPSGKRQILHKSRPLDERIPVSIPAIIDRKVWEAVQTQLKQNSLRNRKAGSFFLLKGRVKCGLCGRTCAAETSGRISPVTDSRRTYYRCKGTKTGAYPKCNLSSVSSKTNSKNPGLDDLVWAEIVKIISNPDLIKEHLDKEEDTDTINSLKDRITRLETKLNDLLKQKDELLSLRMEGLLTAEELKKRLVKLENKKKATEADLNDAQNVLKSTETVRIDPIEFCEYFQGRIKKPSNEIKSQVVNDLDIKVIIYSKSRFEVYWPFAEMTTGSVIEREVFITNKPVSMTPEIKEALQYYCKQNSTSTSVAIRRAIREAPLNTSFTKRPRGNRFRSTVELTQEDIRKVSMLQQAYNVSSSQAVEWALEVFLKSQN